MRALFDRFKSDYMQALQHLPDFGGRFTGLRVIPAVSAPVTNDSAPAGPRVTPIITRPVHRRPRVEKTAATSMIDGRSTVMR
jgi:hypothetical protein